MCGNDAGAKADLGDISNARGSEMWLPLWVRLYGALQTPMFGMKITR